jgi:hypothetical protein
MTTAAEPEVRCRSCGGTDGLTRIFRLDECRSFYPHAAVCHGCAPPVPPVPAKRAPVGGDPRQVVTAFRPGTCRGCAYDILPGEPITGTDDGWFHARCAGLWHGSTGMTRQRSGSAITSYAVPFRSAG